MTNLELLALKMPASFDNPLLLESALDEIEQQILNYCNISVVPLALKYTWVNMARDLLIYEFESTLDPSEVASASLADLSAITIGDTQLTLAGNTGTNQRNQALRSHRPNLDALILNYGAQLNKFRRLVW